VTHLWEYDSLAHRAQIRANLAGDPEWISDYVTHLTPMLQEQENAVVSQPHWASEMAAPKENDGHFYLMEVLQVKTTELANIVATSEHMNRGRLVNCLVDDIGTKNRMTLIWQFDSLDDTRGLDYQTDLITEKKSIVMLPAPWSPLK